MYKLCKTEQSARRQRELEHQLVLQMNSKRFDEITVSDFCIQAGIPRKAFYRYFSSMEGALYALLDHTMMEYEHFREPYAAVKADNLFRELECFFQFWKDQRLLLDGLMLSGLSGVMLERIIQYMESVTTQKHLRQGESEYSQRQIVRFTISGIVIMLINWHQEGFRESPRDMAVILTRILNTNLSDYVQELI